MRQSDRAKGAPNLAEGVTVQPEWRLGGASEQATGKLFCDFERVV